jgi:hypothetical protein
MVKSFFLDKIEHLQGVVTAVVKKYNGKNEETETFLYQTHLDKKLSIDGRWSSVIGMFKRLVADYVAVGAPATLKSRGSKGVAEGEIPKVSNKYQLTEKQFEDIQTMEQKGVAIKDIIRELFQDAVNAVLNIYRRNEMSFLGGLCNGVIAVDKEVSDGTEIRANFGYKQENEFKVIAANKVEVEDIQAIVDKSIADGNRITTLFLDNASLTKLKNSTSLRQSFANNAGVVLSNGGDYPVLNAQKVKEYFLSEWGITLITGVDKTFQLEDNGNTKSHKPWTDGIMIFSTSSVVGSLIHSYTVEHTHRLKQADYAEADYILVSKYGDLDPLVEFTKAEAKCLPVISNADGIYRLDSNVAKTELPEG